MATRDGGHECSMSHMRAICILCNCIHNLFGVWWGPHFWLLLHFAVFTNVTVRFEAVIVAIASAHLLPKWLKLHSLLPEIWYLLVLSMAWRLSSLSYLRFFYGSVQCSRCFCEGVYCRPVRIVVSTAAWSIDDANIAFFLHVLQSKLSLTDDWRLLLIWPITDAGWQLRICQGAWKFWRKWIFWWNSLTVYSSIWSFMDYIHVLTCSIHLQHIRRNMNSRKRKWEGIHHELFAQVVILSFEDSFENCFISSFIKWSDCTLQQRGSLTNVSKHINKRFAVRNECLENGKTSTGT